MAKKFRRELLFITVFLSILLSYSVYASPIPSVHAAEIIIQEKGLATLGDVVGVDLTKYATETKEYRQDSYFGVVPQEKMRYCLESNGSKLDILCTFTDGALHILHVLEHEGSPRMTQSATSVLEMAKGFLSNYQSYSKNSFYGGLGAMLDSVDADKNLTTTYGNVKLEVTNSGDYETFRWTYTFDGVGAACKCVALSYKDGFLKYFIDTWDLYKIGSTSINLSEEEAIAIAVEHAKTYSWKVVSGNDTFEVKDFKVTKAVATQLVFCTSLNADNAHSQDLLTLYPMWRIGVGLDKFYPGNVYGIYVDIWADTKEVRHVQATFSKLDPQLIESQLFDESTVEALNGQASVGEAQSNSISITWIALPAFAAVVLGTAPFWLSRKKKSSKSYRLPKLHSFRIGGVLLCLLISSTVLLSPISTVNADEPEGRAMIWGSEWNKNYTYPSPMYFYYEIMCQRYVADELHGYFIDNSYEASNYQGSATVKSNILYQIGDSEQNYPRLAVVYFDHGVGNETQLDGGNWHYMVVDNSGTYVYDMDIYDKTALGNKPLFAFISTCMSANLTSHGPYGGGHYPSGAAVGMPYAWTHRVVGTNMSDDGYDDPDGGDFPCYIGFPFGSPTLIQLVDTEFPDKHYYHWVLEFFECALSDDISVIQALDLASNECFGSDFGDTALHTGFTAIWPGFSGSPAPGCTMVVYGNGGMHLYQPSLSVPAYDQYGNQVTANVYIDGKYVGTTGHSFRVSPGSHTLEVSVPSDYDFKNFTYYGGWSTENPMELNISSDLTVTAHYVDQRTYYWLTVYAYDNGQSYVPTEVSIDEEWHGMAGDSFKVPAGNHYISVENVVYENGAQWWFMGFDCGDPWENPVSVSINSNTAVTAWYWYYG